MDGKIGKSFPVLICSLFKLGMTVMFKTSARVT